MVQRNQVLTEGENRIPFVAARRTIMQEDYPTVTEREVTVNATEQTWMFEAGEEARAGRTTPTPVNALAKITNWLNHLGSRRIDDSCLEARHNIHHNFKINGIGR